MLFSSVAKVEPLVLKSNHVLFIDCIIKALSTNLGCIFRKSYEVTTWTPITAYKLVEYLVNIHLMLFKEIHVVLNVHCMVFKHDIFLCLQFICYAFCSDLKSENMRDSVQQGTKK